MSNPKMPRRGPKPGNRSNDHSALDTVKEHYGKEAPDWMLKLAEHCDRLGSNRMAADAMGCSPAAVSQLLRNKYPASTDALEAAARQAFMEPDVQCPVLGLLSGADCNRWQKQTRPDLANSKAVRVYRGCRSGCPHSRIACYAHLQSRRRTG